LAGDASLVSRQLDRAYSGIWTGRDLYCADRGTIGFRVTIAAAPGKYDGVSRASVDVRNGSGALRQLAADLAAA